MTTERNLRKIKENSQHKIKNQIRFSKRNDLLFKTPVQHFESLSLEYDLTTMGNTPAQNNSVYSTYRGSSFQGSVPEGVNQISIPLGSTNNSIINTDSIAPLTTRIAQDSIATDRMTQRTRGSIISDNIQKSKMGPKSVNASMDQEVDR